MNGIGKAFEAIADKVDGGWLVVLFFAALIAWVTIKAGPKMVELYVKDRESRRQHHERMTRLNHEHERRQRRQARGQSQQRRRAGSGGRGNV